MYDSKYEGAEVEALLDMVANGEAGGGVYITPFTVEQFVTGYVEISDEQRNELLDAASQNRIIGMPRDNSSVKGYIVTDYGYLLSEEDDSYWGLDLGVIYNGAHYSSNINSSGSIDFRPSRVIITPFKPLIYTVTVKDGVANVYDNIGYPDNCIYVVDGECTELNIYLEPGGIGHIIKFFTGESCSLSFVFDVYWANGKLPTIEPYTHYELSLAANANYGYNAVLTPFKVVE